MYWREPPQDELAAFGLTVDDVRPEDVEVWPENAQAVGIFTQMRTQWRMGFAGPIGLDYTALQTVMRINGILRNEQCELYRAVQIMEQAALDEMTGE